jgi:hypothetical protein
MLALASVMSVSADESTTQMTLKLNNLQTIGGTLAGDHAGAFWYATMDYPGESAALTIDMYFTPADPAMQLGVGFDLYDANGLVGTGILVDNGLLELTYTSESSGQLLLVVHNYIDGSIVDFNVTADGVTSTATADTTTEAVAVISETIAVETPAVVVPMTGVIMGNAAGSFNRFAVTYATAASVTLDLYYTPADDLISQGVDLHVYGLDGEVALDSAKSDGNGVLELSFTPVAGQMYQFVVENYIPDLLISYNIQSSVAPSAVTIGG